MGTCADSTAVQTMITNMLHTAGRPQTIGAEKERRLKAYYRKVDRMEKIVVETDAA